MKVSTENKSNPKLFLTIGYGAVCPSLIIYILWLQKLAKLHQCQLYVEGMIVIFSYQREIDQEAKGISQQNEDTNALKKQKSQSVKATPYAARRIEPKGTTRPGSITGKKAVSKTSGKENVPEKMAAKKGKVSKR